MEPSALIGLAKLGGGICAFGLLTIGFRRLSNKVVQKIWRGKERLKIVEVWPETHDILKVGFVRSNQQKFPNFLPGQFLSIQIGNDSKTIRSYSICSSNLKPSMIQIAVKKLSHGIGSNWVHSLKVGDEVWSYPPSGHFVDSGIGNEQRVYLAGGIGVTPMVSMIKSNLERKTSIPMLLIYGMRSEKDKAFHDELTDLSKNHSNIQYVPVIGNIDFEVVRANIKDLNHSRYFLCGPTAMMDSLTSPLLDAGVDESNIFTEKFVSPSTIDDSKIPYREAEVTIHGETYQYKGKQNLLEFAESQGLEIPFSCRSGVCGSCRCRVKGEFEVLTDAGLSLSDRKKGYVLSCVAYPKGNVSLDPVDVSV